MSANIPPRWHINEEMFDAYTVKSLSTSDMHWHSHFLLNIITEGEGVQVINGKNYPFSQGSVILLSPLDFHRNIIDEGKRVSMYAVKFSDKLFYDSLGSFCELSDFPAAAMLPEEDFKDSKALFSMLLNEQKNKYKLGSEKFAQNIIEQLVILALRACGRIPKSETESHIHKALAFIHYNFRRNIRVSEVAAYVGYSPNYFSSEFKKETGTEFRKYLHELRLDFAMNLLKFSNLSVTEVCFESGFNTLPHFSQTFKKKFGKSPERIKEDQK